MATAKSKTTRISKPRAGHDKKRVAVQREPTVGRKRSGPAASVKAAKSDTKHAKIIAMLGSTSGATIAAMMTTTGWQQHSVRGFLAGVVRKRLKLDLDSEQTDKGRVYRIKARRSANDKARPANAAA